MVLIALVLYPSNLFFERGYLTMAYPEGVDHYSSTEPVLEYKSISQGSKDIIQSSPLVVLWSPGAEWYLKKPDYIIPFSLSGLESGYMLVDGRDIYTNAEVFSNQVNDFILIEDIFGYLKLNEEELREIESLKEDCTVLEELRTLRISKCPKG